MNIQETEFDKSENQLLIELANELIKSNQIRFSTPPTESDKRERALRWLNSFLTKIKDKICFDPAVVNYLQNPNTQNKAEIAGVIVDLLTASSIGMPVGTLAVLLTKGRLQSLCS